MSTTLLRPVTGTRKRRDVKAAIRKLALKIGPGGKLPTVREFCQSLGVAKATVDTALDALETDGAIRRKHGSGIYVTSRIHQRTIGLVFGGNIFRFGVSPFYSMLIGACARRAKGHNENFSFFLDLPETEGASLPVHRDLADAIQRRRLHGMLLAGMGRPEQLDWLRGQSIPCVIYSPSLREPNVARFDFHEMTRLGVESLVSQGCRRIGMLAGLGYARPLDDDVCGYVTALAGHGLEQRPEWIVDCPLNADGEIPLTNEEHGYEMMKRMFTGWSRAEASRFPDSVVSTDDMLTRGALVAARKLGLEIGRDVRIATHANKGSPALKGFEGELTLLEIDLDELIEPMFGMLETLMDGRKPEQEIILVKPRLA